MNTQLYNELHAQCISREVRGTNASNSYVVDKFDSEKFAQLIVRECALQCVHNEDMDLIEKHFGVEE